MLVKQGNKASIIVFQLQESFLYFCKLWTVHKKNIFSHFLKQGFEDEKRFFLSRIFKYSNTARELTGLPIKNSIHSAYDSFVFVWCTFVSSVGEYNTCVIFALNELRFIVILHKSTEIFPPTSLRTAQT